MTPSERGMLTELHDIKEISQLQARYLYYMQSHEYDRVLDLFALDDLSVSVEISSTGVYVGAEKIRALFLELFKPLFTSPGSLPIHMMSTEVVEVSADGASALGMWQTLGCNAFPTSEGLVATWQQGKYDNAFSKTGDRWRILRLRWLCNFRTPFHEGWVRQPMSTVAPLDLSHFPERCHPSRPSEPFEGYDPAQPMDFGPLPPERAG
ncbi:nuclear transport factor 2 family protein [Tsuneonella sp. HG222]